MTKDDLIVQAASLGLSEDNNLDDMTTAQLKALIKSEETQTVTEKPTVVVKAVSLPKEVLTFGTDGGKSDYNNMDVRFKKRYDADRVSTTDTQLVYEGPKHKIILNLA